MSTSRIWLVAVEHSVCVYCRLKYLCLLQIFSKASIWFFFFAHPHPLDQNSTRRKVTGEQTKPVQRWSNEGVSVCLMFSTCYSTYIWFTALTPTHMEHSADAETSAPSSSVVPRSQLQATHAGKLRESWSAFPLSLCCVCFAGVLYCLHCSGHCRKKERKWAITVKVTSMPWGWPQDPCVSTVG